MVDIRPACRVFHTRTLPPAAEKAREWSNKPDIFRVTKLSGLDLEQEPRSSGVEAELCFLTSLFIELIEVRKGEGKAHACDNA